MTSAPRQSIEAGHYARKQLLCKDRLIAWSHRRRFAMGQWLARDFAGGRVLDYGCGDGAFLAMLMAEESAPVAAVGSELARSVVDDCRARLGAQRGLSFVLDAELDAPEHAAAYDLVVCMEVLEHVVDIEPLLDRFARLLAPSGRLLVSVPVETGLPLVVKQAARRVAGWRGLGDYPGIRPYTASEFCKSVLAGRRQHIPRASVDIGEGAVFPDHKGFNWMTLRDALAQRFQLEKTRASPLAWLPPQLASQVWFFMRLR